MKIEDEQALKDAVHEAEYALQVAANEFSDAALELNTAEQELNKWFSIYG